MAAIAVAQIAGHDLKLLPDPKMSKDSPPLLALKKK